MTHVRSPSMCFKILNPPTLRDLVAPSYSSDSALDPWPDNPVPHRNCRVARPKLRSFSRGVSWLTADISDAAVRATITAAGFCIGTADIFWLLIMVPKGPATLFMHGVEKVHGTGRKFGDRLGLREGIVISGLRLCRDSLDR